MSGDGSLGYWSHETIHSSSHRRNDNGIFDENFLKCIQVMEEMVIGTLIQETLHLGIMEVIIVVTLVEMDICHNIPATISIEIVKFIISVLMVYVQLCLKKPSTIHIAIM